MLIRFIVIIGMLLTTTLVKADSVTTCITVGTVQSCITTDVGGRNDEK